MNNTIKFNTDDFVAEYPPSRVCTVCGVMEYPKAHIIHETFWLCEDCKNVFKTLVNDYKKCMEACKND